MQKLSIVSILAIALLLLQFQNCSGGGFVEFSRNRESLSSAEQGGGTTYDGKPEPGNYCRVFDNISCQTQVSDIQSTLRVDNTKIQLTSDNCTSTATNFQFSDVTVGLSNINREFIGLSRGIFKKCEVNSSGNPLPPTEMPDAWCKSNQNNVDVVVNKNLATQELKLELRINSGLGVRIVNRSNLQKSQNANSSSYSLSREKFDLNISVSTAQTSPGRLRTLVDNTEINVDLDCRQAERTSTILIDRDLELHSSWVDTNRLSGYWKLNEVNAVQGATITDSSAYGFHGMLQTNSDGANKSVSTAQGSAIRLDGIDDSISVGNPTDGHLDFDTRSFTYMAWINKTGNAGSFDMPMWKGGNSATNTGYEMECGSNVCSAYICDGTTIVGAPFAANGNGFIGRWVHLTAVVDRSRQELRTYVDGALVSTVNISTVGSVTEADPIRGALRIGGGFTNQFLHLGSIDDVAIWNNSLTNTEILEIFQRLRPKFY